MQEGIFGKKKVHESLVREEGKGSYEMKSKSRNENTRESTGTNGKAEKVQEIWKGIEECRGRIGKV